MTRLADHDSDWTSPDAPWRSDPATDKQRAKLAYFGIRMADGISKGEASEMIDAAIDQFPDVEERYQAQKEAREDEEFDLTILNHSYNDEELRETYGYRELTDDELLRLRDHFRKTPQHEQLSPYEFSALIPSLIPEAAIGISQTDRSGKNIGLVKEPLPTSEGPTEGASNCSTVSRNFDDSVARGNDSRRRIGKGPAARRNAYRLARWSALVGLALLADSWAFRQIRENLHVKLRSWSRDRTPAERVVVAQPLVGSIIPERSPRPLPSGRDALAAQRRAIEKYPQLSIEGSQWNRTFVTLTQRLLQTEPQLFDDPEWPTRIADRIAASEQEIYK